MIPGFLSNTLNTKELEGFINHVKECPDCYEELEIMLILSIGLQELNEDSRISYNFGNLLENKIKEAEFYCERIKRMHRINFIVFLILHMSVMIGITMQVIQWI